MTLGRGLRTTVTLYVLVAATGGTLAAQVPFPRIAVSYVGHQRRWSSLIYATVLFACEGKNSLAVYAARTALRVAEETFGPEDFRISTSLNYLALLYEGQGQYAEAEALFRRSLSIRERVRGGQDPAVADDLVSLARLNVRQLRYSQAEFFLRRALEIRKKPLGIDVITETQNDPAGLYRAALANTLNDLARIYTLQPEPKYPEAEELYQQTLQVQKALAPESPDVADTMNDLAALYVVQSRYAEAEDLYRCVIEIQRDVLGADDPAVGQTWTNLALLYEKQGKQLDAAKARSQATIIRAQVLASLQGRLGPCGKPQKGWEKLVSQSFALFNQFEYPKEIPLAQELLGAAKVTCGAENYRVSAYQVILAAFVRQKGQYPEAESLLQQALRVQEKVLGTEDPTLAETLDRLAALYRAELRYDEAERVYRRAMQLQEKGLGLQAPEDPFISDTRMYLAALYEEQSKYPEAESLFQDALRIEGRAKGPAKPRDYAMARLHSGLASLYRKEADMYGQQRNYREAEQHYEKALQLEKKAFGFGLGRFKNAAMAQDSRDLAFVYAKQDRKAEAEGLYRRTRRLDEKAWGARAATTAWDAWALAETYQREGKSLQAEQLLQAELRRYQEWDWFWATENTAKQLARLYMSQGKYSEAQPLLQQALSMQRKEADADNLSLSDTLNHLGVISFAQAEPRQAGFFFDESFQIIYRQLQNRFPYLNEKERLKFVSTVESWFPQYFSFVLKFHSSDPKLVGTMYNLLLWRKALVVRSLEALGKLVKASRLKEPKELWAELSQTISQLENTDRVRQSTEVVRLEEHADYLEERLRNLFSSVSLQRSMLTRPFTWQEVRDSLGQGEAAVEFVRFRYGDGKKWTDTTYYVALVLTKEMTEAPVFICFGTGEDLEGKALEDYRRLITAKTADALPHTSLYESYWKPLETVLGTRDRVYISPDGVLNLISLGIVRTPDGLPLMKRYDLRMLSSTANLVPESRSSITKTALLIGNPKFLLSVAEQQQALSRLNVSEPGVIRQPIRYSSSTADNDRGASQAPRALLGLRANEDCPDLPLGGVLCPLGKESETELNDIFKALIQQGWQVRVPYTQENALEEVVEQVSRPQVLHLSTHGFFTPDQPSELDNPRTVGLESSSEWKRAMLWSWLAFAGADSAPFPGLESGVLTAARASELDLDGTELVVLSACETGTGKAEDGEGVFGLRRGFQEAGAQSLLMSLWSVPERETAELMTSFYRNWLAEKQKPEKHQALRQAQLALREKVMQEHDGADLPYYWGGAFVLVDLGPIGPQNSVGTSSARCSTVRGENASISRIPVNGDAPAARPRREPVTLLEPD